MEEPDGGTIEEVEAPKKKIRSFGIIDFNAPMIEQPPAVFVTALFSMVKNVFSGVYNAVKTALFEAPSSDSSDVLIDSDTLPVGT